MPEKQGMPRAKSFTIVHRVISRRHTVGFKRVWMRGVSEEHIRSIRNERTTTQTDPFQANPLGRGQLADFRRCSLLTYRSRYARRNCQSGSDRLEYQPSDRRRYASYL